MIGTREPDWGELLALFAAIVFGTVLYLRAISVVARWMALGPGQVAVRWNVGSFLLSLLYALPLFLQRQFNINGRHLEGFAWLTLPFAVQLGGWLILAAIGENDVLNGRCARKRGFGLRDAFLALALFSVSAATLRLAIGGDIGRTISGDASDRLYFGGIYAALLLLAFGIDLGVRAMFASPSDRPKRQLDAETIGCLGAAGIVTTSALILPLCLVPFVVPIVSILAIVYAGAAMLQEALVRRVGVRATRLTSVSGPSDSGATA